MPKQGRAGSIKVHLKSKIWLFLGVLKLVVNRCICDCYIGVISSMVYDASFPVSRRSVSGVGESP